MMNFKFLISNFKYLIVLLFLLFGFVKPVLATTEEDSSFRIEQPPGAFGLRLNLPDFGAGGNCEGESAESAVQKIVKTVVGILFTVGAIGTLIIFLWGTVEWIFSGGDKERISNARKRITNALIGLLLMSLAYMILNVVGKVINFNILGPLQIPGWGPQILCQ